jgi:hypothetical protein
VNETNTNTNAAVATQTVSIREQAESKGEAIEMAKNLCADFKTRIRVIDCFKAIPRRFVAVSDSVFAERYDGKDWAKVVFTAVF